MCDYSLDFVASRPAKVGDKLVSTHFRSSITRGFAPVGEPGVAVCLLPGTRVMFGKWSGTEIKIDGIEYLIMKESDIMGVLVETEGWRKTA